MECHKNGFVLLLLIYLQIQLLHLMEILIRENHFKIGIHLVKILLLQDNLSKIKIWFLIYNSKIKSNNFKQKIKTNDYLSFMFFTYRIIYIKIILIIAKNYKIYIIEYNIMYDEDEIPKEWFCPINQTLL